MYKRVERSNSANVIHGHSRFSSQSYCKILIFSNSKNYEQKTFT